LAKSVGLSTTLDSSFCITGKPTRGVFYGMFLRVIATFEAGHIHIAGHQPRIEGIWKRVKKKSERCI